jgi:transmembrane sensor
MMDEKIKVLLNKYELGKCSEEENAWIETWYNNLIQDTKTDLSNHVIEEDLYAVYKTLPTSNEAYPIKHWLQIAASVIFILSLSIGAYVYLNTKPYQKLQTLAKINKAQDNLSKNKNYLILANGDSISLDQVAVGIISVQNGVKITKIKEGLIAYTSYPTRKNKNISAITNKISTGKGGQYQVILADGTNVWLNAASSLEFPTSFISKNRKVELTGEGYFEVSKNKSQPFKVLTKLQLIEVLGTHFNINCYDDEPATKTTLLEGSVLVRQLKTKNSILLKPGEQSILEDYKKIKIAKVKPNHTIAWKNGLFQFQDSDIQNVMRQLSRWYDVDIDFDGKVPDTKLWGEVHRNVSIEKALEILSYFDLKYKILNNGHRKKITIKSN